MRYDHYWILACMMLRIKNAKGYAHLRDHHFLCLPSRSTVQRCIDIIHLETGVSEDMINILQKKISSKPEHHGVLMFDEVQLRESFKFSPGNLKFEGLVDFGDFTPKGHEQKYADTGLVFMYHLILGNWIQAVQIFFSKGPTPSTVLSKC